MVQTNNQNVVVSKRGLFPNLELSIGKLHKGEVFCHYLLIFGPTLFSDKP